MVKWSKWSKWCSVAGWLVGLSLACQLEYTDLWRICTALSLSMLLLRGLVMLPRGLQRVAALAQLNELFVGHLPINKTYVPMNELHERKRIVCTARADGRVRYYPKGTLGPSRPTPHTRDLHTSASRVMEPPWRNMLRENWIASNTSGSKMRTA